jgi:hypothetical protein
MDGLEARIPFLCLVMVETASYFIETRKVKECKKNADGWNADNSAPTVAN